MIYAKVFAAGFLAVLIFHQGVIGVFYVSGLVPFAPFSMAATAPLGVPSVISISFWGGVWALALWPLIRRATGSAYWWRCVVFGAIGPSAVALFIVFPLKGREFAAGWDPKIIIGALIVNGAWGYGLGLFQRLFRKF